MDGNAVEEKIDKARDDMRQAMHVAQMAYHSSTLSLPRSLFGYGPLEWKSGRLQKNGTLWLEALRRHVPCPIPLAILWDIFATGVFLALFATVLSPPMVMVLSLAVCVLKSPFCGLPAWVLGSALHAFGFVTTSDAILVVACAIPLSLSSPFLMDIPASYNAVSWKACERYTNGLGSFVGLVIAPLVTLVACVSSGLGNVATKCVAFVVVFLGCVLCAIPGKEDVTERSKSGFALVLLFVLECVVGFLVGVSLRNAGAACGAGLSIALPLLCWNPPRALLCQSESGSFHRPDALLSSLSVLVGSGAYKRLYIYGPLLSAVCGLMAGILIVCSGWGRKRGDRNYAMSLSGIIIAVLPVWASFGTITILLHGLAGYCKTVDIMRLRCIAMAGTAGHLAWRIAGRRFFKSTVLKYAGKREMRKDRKVLGRNAYLDLVRDEVGGIHMEATDWSRLLGRFIGGVAAGCVVFLLGFGVEVSVEAVLVTLFPELDAPYPHRRNRKFHEAFEKNYTQNRKMTVEAGQGK